MLGILPSIGEDVLSLLQLGFPMELLEPKTLLRFEHFSILIFQALMHFSWTAVSFLSVFSSAWPCCLHDNAFSFSWRRASSSPQIFLHSSLLCFSRSISDKSTLALDSQIYHKKITAKRNPCFQQTNWRKNTIISDLKDELKSYIAII